jgi:very-short-patch-repair endonuclease/glutathione peroxidase-family protein
MKQTNLKKYGVEYVSQSPEVREKIKQISLEKYGVENPLQSPEVREKIKQTNLERYGVEYATQSLEVKEKMKQTNLERYGAEYPFATPEAREKSKQVNLERYGAEYTFQSPEIKEKIKQTNLKKYGVEYPLQSSEIYEKKKKTTFERYGVEHATQSLEVKEKMKQTNLEKYGEKSPGVISSQRNKTPEQIYISDNTLTLIQKPEYQGQTLQWWAEQRGDTSTSGVAQIFRKEENRHYRQFISYYKWKGPEKIKEVLNNFGISYKEEKKYPDCKDINPLPFDFYLSEFDLLIEYDGGQHFEIVDGWGGEEKFEETQRHDEMKDKYAADNGIKLLRIPYWDYENIEEIILNKLDEISGILEDVS